jgi:kumamolisin
MQRFHSYLSSIFDGKRLAAAILCVITLAGLQPVSRVQAQSAATGSMFSNSIKEPVTAATSAAAVPKNVPTVVRSQLTDAETQAPIDFSIALKMRNFAELQQRVGMHEIIPLEEIRAKYLPAAADVEKVRQWLIGQGFQVQPAAQYELSVFARGTVAQLQRVFGTTFARVQFRGEEHTSAVTAPSLPADIAEPVQSINGLQPHLHPTRHLVPKATAGAQKLINNAPPYYVSEIANAYDASTANGAGQKIGIVIDTFPNDTDLTAFWADNGVPQSLNNIEKVPVFPGRSLPAPSGEETLDVSWSSGIASGAKIRIYAVADSQLLTSELDQAYQYIINDLPNQPELHQISMSYGLGETYLSSGQLDTDDGYFATIAGNGVTLFAASGDGGSNPDSNGNYGGPLQVENPASDPNVTGVGGTSLRLNSNGSVSSETVWFNSSGASGGGQSQDFSRPTWQPGSGTIPGNGRLVPDVALDADPNTGVFLILNRSQAQIGGTSVGAPVWAGICARINQVRAGNGAPSLGLLGAKIYPLLGSSSFRDITSGSNGAYSAGPGFDLCTGIGVPDVNNQINALEGILPQGSGVAKDFSNDGYADLVWEESVTGQRLIWLMNNGAPTTSINLPTVDPSWHIAGVGDFLGNSQSDLVWENTASGQHLIWILLAGVPQYAITLPTVAGGWHIVGAGDFNGDGQADLVWENSVTGQREIWLMNHGSSTTAIVLPTVDPSWHIAGVGDFLGDKQADLVWENMVTGNRLIWLMNGGTPTTSITLPTVDPSWHIGGAGDFMRTGHADLVWENTSNGQCLIWLFNNGQPTSAIGLPTVPTDWHIVDH